MTRLPHPAPPRRVARERRRSPAGQWRRAASAVALAVAAVSVPAAEVSVAVQRRGDGIAIEARATLDADAATAWRVLTDYDRYPEFAPDLVASRVVAREGTKVTVEQLGDARVWMLRVPLAVTYEITEFPPHRLHSRAVSGSMRLLEGEYRLAAVPSGARLDYSGLAATRAGLLGPLERWVIEDNASRQLRALAEAIERRARGGAVPVAGGPDRGGR